MSCGSEVVARFTREVALVQRVNHPHVLPIHGVYEDGPHLFLVIPQWQGDLAAWLAEHGHTPIEVWRPALVPFHRGFDRLGLKRRQELDG